VLAGDAAHVGNCVVPPLLGKQKGLVNRVERRALPCGAHETAILRQRLDARLRALSASARSANVPRKSDRLLEGLLHELETLAGREAEMSSPVEIGTDQHHRRQPGGEARRGCVHGPIDDFSECSRRIGVANERGVRRHRHPFAAVPLQRVHGTAYHPSRVFIRLVWVPCVALSFARCIHRTPLDYLPRMLTQRLADH
jgi:hypothetical protein